MSFPQSGWIEQVSGTTQNLTSIFFTDINNGFIVGNAGTLLKTTDGGTTWNLKSLGTTVNLRSISFLDSQNGYIFGPGKTFYKTTDGGNSWLNLSDSIKYSFAAISFLDLQNGIAIQSTPYDTAKIYQTTDGGLSWNYLSKVYSDIYYICLPDIYYLDENTIVASGYRAFNAVVYQSTDGGLTWAFRLSGGNSSGGIGYNKMQFINSTTDFLLANGGMTSCYSAYIYKTLNGGTNWVRVDDGTLPLCSSIFMLDQNNGFTVGKREICSPGPGSKIYKMISGGNTWTQQLDNTTVYLKDIYFVDSNNGIAVGDNGVIFKTTNGGVSFIENEENNSTLPKEFLLNQNYPNPFNPSTTIKYQLPEMSFVTIKVYDILGREVATLVNEEKPAGSYEVQFSNNSVYGRNLTSGIYFYQIKTGEYSETKKMILLK